MGTIEFKIIIDKEVFMNTHLTEVDINNYFNDYSNIFKLKFDEFNLIEINSNDVTVLPYINAYNQLVLSVDLY